MFQQPPVQQQSNAPSRGTTSSPPFPKHFLLTLYSFIETPAPWKPPFTTTDLRACGDRDIAPWCFNRADVMPPSHRRNFSSPPRRLDDSSLFHSPATLQSSSHPSLPSHPGKMSSQGVHNRFLDNIVTPRHVQAVDHSELGSALSSHSAPCSPNLQLGVTSRPFRGLAAKHMDVESSRCGSISATSIASSNEAKDESISLFRVCFGRNPGAFSMADSNVDGTGIGISACENFNQHDVGMVSCVEEPSPFDGVDVAAKTVECIPGFHDLPFLQGNTFSSVSVRDDLVSSSVGSTLLSPTPTFANINNHHYLSPSLFSSPSISPSSVSSTSPFSSSSSSSSSISPSLLEGWELPPSAQASIPFFSLAGPNVSRSSPQSSFGAIQQRPSATFSSFLLPSTNGNSELGGPPPPSFSIMHPPQPLGAFADQSIPFSWHSFQQPSLSSYLFDGGATTISASPFPPQLPIPEKHFGDRASFSSLMDFDFPLQEDLSSMSALEIQHPFSFVQQLPTSPPRLDEPLFWTNFREPIGSSLESASASSANTPSFPSSMSFSAPPTPSQDYEMIDGNLAAAHLSSDQTLHSLSSSSSSIRPGMKWTNVTQAVRRRYSRTDPDGALVSSNPYEFPPPESVTMASTLSSTTAPSLAVDSSSQDERKNMMKTFRVRQYRMT